MYFHTVLFVLFFVTVFIGVRVLPRPGWFVLAASGVFYVMAGWLDALLILSVIVANWLLLKYVSHEKWRLVSAICVNLGVLAYFKYQGFLFGFLDSSISYVSIILPLGISFYTFQIIAFHVDSVRGTASRPRSFADFSLFVSFFPQLIAGPIVRAEQLMPQVRRMFNGNQRKVRLVSYGLAICLVGLVKKVFFADSIAPHVDLIFSDIPPSILYAWLGAWLFTFQIYFDFSGYSDIAVGCAYLLGVRIPFNFRTPYLSTSPKEFWKRWHITLSTWIRDYLYIPLGGSHHGAVISGIVLVVVMAIAGLWHGAGWNFIVWGALWGIYIVAMRFVPSSAKLPIIIKWVGHMGIVVLLWVFFRSPDLEFALNYVLVMIGLGGQGGYIPDLPMLTSYVAIGAALLMVLHLGEEYLHRTVAIRRFKRFESPLFWGLLVGLCAMVVIVPTFSANPFIYFRF